VNAFPWVERRRFIFSHSEYFYLKFTQHGILNNLLDIHIPWLFGFCEMVAPPYLGSMQVSLPQHLCVLFLKCKHSIRAVIIVVVVCYLARQPPVGHGLLIHEVSRSHTTTHHSQDSSGRVISSSQRTLPDHTTLTTDKYPCFGWDLNPQSQQASGRRPKP